MVRELSAGAVVCRDDKFLLLHYPAGHWGFVKGHVEAGETLLEAMRRELREETGITNVRVVPGFMEVTDYDYHGNHGLVSKRVFYFLAESFTDKVVLSAEHVGFAWLPFVEALDKLTFSNDQRVLRRAYERLG